MSHNFCKGMIVLILGYISIASSLVRAAPPPFLTIADDVTRLERSIPREKAVAFPVLAPVYIQRLLVIYERLHTENLSEAEHKRLMEEERAIKQRLQDDVTRHAQALAAYRHISTDQALWRVDSLADRFAEILKALEDAAKSGDLQDGYIALGGDYVSIGDIYAQAVSILEELCYLSVRGGVPFSFSLKRFFISTLTPSIVTALAYVVLHFAGVKESMGLIIGLMEGFGTAAGIVHGIARTASDSLPTNGWNRIAFQPHALRLLINRFFERLETHHEISIPRDGESELLSLLAAVEEKAQRPVCEVLEEARRLQLTAGSSARAALPAPGTSTAR